MCSHPSLYEHTLMVYQCQGLIGPGQLETAPAQASTRDVLQNSTEKCRLSYTASCPYQPIGALTSDSCSM